MHKVYMKILSDKKDNEISQLQEKMYNKCIQNKQIKVLEEKINGLEEKRKLYHLEKKRQSDLIQSYQIQIQDNLQTISSQSQQFQALQSNYEKQALSNEKLKSEIKILTEQNKIIQNEKVEAISEFHKEKNQNIKLQKIIQKLKIEKKINETDRLKVDGGLNIVENDIVKVMKDREKDYNIIQQLMREKEMLKSILKANNIQFKNQSVKNFLDQKSNQNNLRNHSQDGLLTQSSNDDMIGASRLRISQSPIKEVMQAPISQQRNLNISQSRNIDILAQDLSNKENEYQIKLAENYIKNQKLELKNQKYFEINKKYSGCQTERLRMPINNSQSIDNLKYQNSNNVYIKLQPVQIDPQMENTLINQNEFLVQSQNTNICRSRSNDNKSADDLIQSNMSQQPNQQIIQARKFLNQNKQILKDVRFKLDNQIVRSSGEKQNRDLLNIGIQDQQIKTNGEQKYIFNDHIKNEFSINNDRFSFVNNQNDLIEDPIINSLSQDVKYDNYNFNNVKKTDQEQNYNLIQNNTQSPQFNNNNFEQSEYVSFQNTQNKQIHKNNQKPILKQAPEKYQQENLNDQFYGQIDHTRNKQQNHDEDDQNLEEDQINNVIKVYKNHLNPLTTIRKNILAPEAAVSQKGRNISKQVLKTEDQLREQMEIINQEEKSDFKQKCRQSLKRKIRIASQENEQLIYQAHANNETEQQTGLKIKKNFKNQVQSVNASLTSSQSAQIQDYQYMYSLKEFLYTKQNQN